MRVKIQSVAGLCRKKLHSLKSTAGGSGCFLNSENPEKLKSIFHEALQVKVFLRQEYLDSACAGDDDIRLEVETLLRSMDEEDILTSSILDEGSLLEEDETSPQAGDLVVALREDPSERYATVAQFAEDLQRYLDGSLVLAAQRSNRYRTARFLRGHRAIVIAAALFALIAIGFGVGIGVLASRVIRDRGAVRLGRSGVALVAPLDVSSRICCFALDPRVPI